MPGSSSTVDSRQVTAHLSLDNKLDSLDRETQQKHDSSTDLDAQAHGVSLDRLDRSSTGARQARQARPRHGAPRPSRVRSSTERLDTLPRQLDSQGSTMPTRRTKYSRASELSSFGCMKRFACYNLHAREKHATLTLKNPEGGSRYERQEGKARRTRGRTMRARFKRWREECPRPR
jgi:hypothetical protein